MRFYLSAIAALAKRLKNQKFSHKQRKSNQQQANRCNCKCMPTAYPVAVHWKLQKTTSKRKPARLKAQLA